MTGSASLLAGYSFRLVTRLGNAADVPRLLPGEVGYDVDVKTLRVGDDSSTPPRIPTTKSTGTFDFSSSGAWTFSSIAMAANGTVDGVDISDLNAASGIMVRKTDNVWGHVSLVTGDNSLQITNPDGTAGNIDIRIHPAIMALIGGGYLTQVITSSRFTGKGTAQLPLEIKDSTTTQVGAVRIANDTETNAGLSNVTAVSPAGLLGLDNNSTVVNHLKSLFQTSLTITTDTSITGTGASGNPLSIATATATQKGGAELATKAELDAGVAAAHIITPATLIQLGKNTPMALALAEALGIAFPIEISDLVMTGPGLLGRVDASVKQAVQVIPFSSKAKILANNPANNNDIVNHATLAPFFPFGAVKTEPKSTGSLPSASTVGKGGIIYDDTKKMPVHSDGTSWRAFNAYDPFQNIWQRTAVLNSTGTNVITLTLTPYMRVKVRISSIFSGSVLQANCAGSWIDVFTEPSSGGTVPGLSCWLASPNGQLYVMYDSSKNSLETEFMYTGSYNGTTSKVANYIGNNAMDSLGPIVQAIHSDWNLQLRGKTSSIVLAIELYQPIAAVV